MEGNKSEDLSSQSAVCSPNLEMEDHLYVKTDHVLMNVLVLERIIQYLTFKDLKNFRQVCLKWSEVSDTKFYKLSLIYVACGHIPLNRQRMHDEKDIQANVEKNNNKLIQRFESTFPQPGMPSNAVWIQGCITHVVLEFEYILKKRGSSFLTEVYFKNFMAPSDNWVDLGYYLSSNVTTLDIRTSYLARIKVSLGMLPNIENLYLANCVIHLSGKIVPKNLTFDHSNFVFYEGKIFHFDGSGSVLFEDIPIPSILLNNYMDFSKIKNLCLKGKLWKLDVGSGAPNLDILVIPDVELVGLRDSQWTTNRLHFKKSICIGDRMEIKSIYVPPNINADGIQVFPIFVEKLSFTYEHQLVAPQIYWLPNLKHLCLQKTYYDIDFTIFDFTNCMSLEDFHLSVYKAYTMDFNRMKFPSCLKRLKLYNVQITADVPWKLDKLVLFKYSLSDTKNILGHIKTTKLALDLESNLEQDEDKKSLMNIWKTCNLQELAIGKIEWSDRNPFLNSNFSNRVDKIGAYFLFTQKMNREGKAIDFTEFRNYCSLSPHEEELDKG